MATCVANGQKTQTSWTIDKININKTRGCKEIVKYVSIKFQRDPPEKKDAQDPILNTQKVTLANICVQFLSLFHEHDYLISLPSIR